MEINLKKGENKDFKIKGWHLLLIITIPLAWLVLALVSVLIFIADILLLDTHHFVFKVIPKKFKD